MTIVDTAVGAFAKDSSDDSAIKELFGALDSHQVFVNVPS